MSVTSPTMSRSLSQTSMTRSMSQSSDSTTLLPALTQVIPIFAWCLCSWESCLIAMHFAINYSNFLIE